MQTRWYLAGIAYLWGVLFLYSPVQADFIPFVTGDLVRISYQGYSRFEEGGMYTAINQSPANTELLTFCLEKEEATSNQELYKAVISTTTDHGGIGGTPDPLDTRTAYLYANALEYYNSNFTQGIFFNTPAIHSNDPYHISRALQQVMWYIEGEWPDLVGERPDLCAALYQLSDNADGSLYNVRVMNLYEFDTDGSRQSVLTPVPEPGTLAMWSILGGCAMFFAYRRRKQAR